MANDMVWAGLSLAAYGLLTAPFSWGNVKNGRKYRFFPDISDCIYDPSILWPFSYWIYFPEFDPWYDVN